MLNKKFLKLLNKKKAYLLLFLLILIFNKYTIVYILSYFRTINPNSVKIILTSNLIIFFIFFFFIIFKYWSYVKIKKKISFFFILLFFFFYVDIFLSIIFYSKKEDETLRRYPFPYDMFRGKPNEKFKYINNSQGFRGDEIKLIKDKKLTIGFFGGSTGYNGRPPIITIISNLLEEDGVESRVYNFSSTSSNHSQHLHRLIEFMEYPFDIVIFYGGGNETEGYYYYDSRPNYPYNFYYKNELNNFSKIILENSFFFYELDKLTGWISRRNIIHKEKNKDFESWTQKILENYFLVLEKTQNITLGSIKPNICLKSNFFVFFQPLNPQNNEVYDMQKKIIKSDLRGKVNNFHDLSLIKDKLNFTDSIHIDDKSNFIVAKEIYDRLKTTVSSCKNS
jgi:Ca2+/Na+ antiporter